MAVSQGFEPKTTIRHTPPTYDNQQLSVIDAASFLPCAPKKRHRFDTAFTNLSIILSLEIDNNKASAYLFFAPAKSGVGIGTPFLLQGAQVASFALRLFLCVIPSFMVGRTGGIRAHRFLVAAVPTRSAHHQLEIGTSLVMSLKHHYKESPMPDLHPNCALNVPYGHIVQCLSVTNTLISFCSFLKDEIFQDEKSKQELIELIAIYHPLSVKLQKLIDQHSLANDVAS